MIGYCKAYIEDGEVKAVHVQTTPIEIEPVEILDSEGNPKSCDCIDFQIESDEEVLASEIRSEMSVDGKDVYCKGNKVGELNG